jgi:hypothetical protein
MFPILFLLSLLVGTQELHEFGVQTGNAPEGAVASIESHEEVGAGHAVANTGHFEGLGCPL